MVVVWELIFSGFGILFFAFIIALSAIKVIPQWERGVVLTLGKYSATLEPGLNFVIPVIQTMIRVDMRIRTVEVEKQEIMTKDNVPMLVNAVVYFKVKNAKDAVTEIEDYTFAVAQLTQAALRNVVGGNELDEVLSDPDNIAASIQGVVEKDTDDWGVDITGINVQEIELPAEMKRAMAKQAESERERRAMIIKAEGELSASKSLSKAALELSSAPGALHLRTLQTINDIAADPSEKIIILVPSDFAGAVTQLLSGGKDSRK